MKNDATDATATAETPAKAPKPQVNYVHLNQDGTVLKTTPRSKGRPPKGATLATDGEFAGHFVVPYIAPKPVKAKVEGKAVDATNTPTVNVNDVADATPANEAVAEATEALQDAAIALETAAEAIADAQEAVQA